MRIAFVDVIPWDYTAETPYEQPLGGTQSAVCYLAVALAKRGHEVTMLTMTRRPGSYRGVTCCSAIETDADGYHALAPDVCIAINSAELAPRLRPVLPGETKRVLWTQHANDQIAMSALANPTVIGAHDGIAFVSEWQRNSYRERFGLSPELPSQCVLRNAIGPCFEQLVDAAAFTLTDKVPLSLAYTSTPFRGLDVLLDMFPQLRRQREDLRLHVFSSMQVYCMDPTEDQRHFGKLYDRCRSMTGVQYRGSVAQRELATELAGVTALAYSNTFAETSCISVMEAMAAGCVVVTTELGALPETAAGFARLVPSSTSLAAYRQEFVAVTEEVLERVSRRDPGLERQLREQVAYIHDECTWAHRAAEWEAWLESL